MCQSTPGRGAVVLVALAALVFGAAAAVAAPPTPGAADVGDRNFPGLGNGGYDAAH
jgi:hypothetical protein